MARRQHRVNLEQLRVLDAIERHGSFAAAAQAMFVVTSAITHTVRNLESNLGLTIFDRSGRNVRFTTEGRTLLHKGRHLLARAAEFDEDVQRLATGWETKLVLSIDQLVRIEPLLPLVAAFFETAPRTSLHLGREAVSGSCDALLSGRADIVVGAPAPGPAGGGFESVVLHETRFVLVAAPGHPLARQTGPIGPRELAQTRSVIVGDTARAIPQLPFGLLDNRYTLAVPDGDAKLQAILLGVGCGFLPQGRARPHVKAGRLVLLDAQVLLPPPSQNTLAWRAGENGRALRWWIAELTKPEVAKRLFH